MSKTIRSNKRRTSFKLSSWILFLILLISCKNKPSNEVTDQIILSIDSLINQNPIKYSDIFSDFHIIPLETKDDCIFSYISNIKIVDSVIYLLDSYGTKSVYLFSLNGDFLSKICKIGRGPEEYLNPTNFDVNREKGTILILDWDSKKVIEYDKNGEYLSSMSFKNRFISFVLYNDKLITYMPFPENPEIIDENLIKIYDKNGTLTSSYLNYQSILKGPDIIEYGLSDYFFNSIEDIKFIPNYSNTVYSIKEKTFLPFLTLTSNNYNLTQKDLDGTNLIENFHDRFEAIKNTTKMFKAYQYSDNDRIAFFKFNIGMTPYYTFYDFKTHLDRCSRRLIDDLTLIYPTLCSVTGDQFVSYIYSDMIEKFNEVVKDNKIQFSFENNEKVKSLSEFSNPIIILFDLKYN